jgi:hypothetical protein
MKPAILAHLLCSLILCSCSAPDDHNSLAVVDSAGISIVNIGAATFESAPEWSFVPEPQFSIGGGVDGDLAWVVSGVFLSDGRIAVVNGAASEVRVYDRAGAGHVAIGGPGEGPGEFRALWRVHRWGADSLLAWDVELRRAFVFSVDGGHGYSMQVSGVGEFSPALHGSPRPGVLLVSAEDRYKGRDMNRVRRDTLELLRVNIADGSTMRAGIFAGQEQYEMSVPPVVLLEPAPFGATTYIGAVANRAIVADGRAGEIVALDSTGQRKVVLRLGVEGAAVMSADRTAFQRANIDETWRPTYLAAKRAFVTEAPIPERMPALGEVIVTPEGEYWIAAYAPEHARESARTWWFIDSIGHVRGRLITPPRFRVLDATASRMLGVVQDELDVETVVVREIMPAVSN